MIQSRLITSTAYKRPGAVPTKDMRKYDKAKADVCTGCTKPNCKGNCKIPRRA